MRALLGFVLAAGACTFAEPADVDALDGTQLSIAAGNEQVGTVGTTLSQPIVIAAQDQDGNSVANLTLELAITTGGGRVESPAITTDVQGNAHALLTLGTVPGANTLEVRILGDAEPVIASAIALVGSPASVTIASGDAQSGAAGTTLSEPLVVRVADQFSNPVPDILVEFAITEGNGSTTEVTTTSDSGGLAGTALVLDTQAGINSVTALVLELPPAAFTATGVAGAPAQLLKTSGDAQSAAVGSTLGEPLVVTVEDVHGNPVAGVPVDFAATTAGGSVTTTSATTAADGTASTSYRLSNTTGINHVTAQVAGLPSLDFIASGLTGTATSITKVSGDGQTGTVNTTLASQLVVVVRDASSNPVQGFLVSFAVVGGNGVAASPTVATDANGQAKTAFRIGTVAGANSVQPRGGSLVGIVFTATGTAGAPTKVLAFQAPATIDPFAPAAQLIARTTDAFNNPVSGRTVTWFVTSGSGALSSISGVTNPNVQTGLTAGNLANVVVEARSTGLTTATFFLDVVGFASHVDVGSVSGFALRTPDINGDGKADLVVYAGATTGLELIINTTPSNASTSTVAPKVSFLAGSTIRDVAFADLTGDGKPDLVVDRTNPSVATCTSSCLTVLVNTTVQGSTNATFSIVDLATPSIAPKSVAVADINGDSKLDIVSTNGITSLVVLFGTGNGAFSSPVLGNVSNAPIRPIVAVVDLNLDGVVDVLTDDPAGSGGSYIRNTTPFGSTTPSFAQPIGMPVGVTADFDLDQKPDVYKDLIGGPLLGRNTTSVGAIDPTITFASTPLVARNAVAADLLGGDGRPELISTDPSGSASIAVAKNQMFFSFAGGFSAQKSMPAGSTQVLRVDVGDLNGDGTPDVVAIRSLNSLQFTLTTLISE